MTFSICARESYSDVDGDEQTRFGVAVATRLPAVGTLCPFASENGAVATQSFVNVELGRRGVAYLDDGLAVEDALRGLLNADEGAPQRQLHGVGPDGTFVFSGEECNPWYGHREGDNYTVAGNLLAGEAVVDAVADAYEARAADSPDAEADAPLAERLIDALAAGQAEGGDKREELSVQSAALLVETTADRERTPSYDDLRIDASATPIEDLRATYELAREADEKLRTRYDDGAGSEAVDGEADEGEADDDEAGCGEAGGCEEEGSGEAYADAADE